jgi:hypothetical protein
MIDEAQKLLEEAEALKKVITITSQLVILF